jgi:hypothetical protein
MLHIELEHDGGITITGDKGALRQMALVLIEATLKGCAERAFVSDEALTRLLVRQIPKER